MRAHHDDEVLAVPGLSDRSELAGLPGEDPEAVLELRSLPKSSSDHLLSARFGSVTYLPV